MVNVLVEFGGNVNAQNSTGMTPLMFAAIQGHCEIVRVLLQHGAIVNIVDNKDYCAMAHAAKSGHLEVVNLLVTSDWITDEKNDLSLSEASQQAAVASSRAGHEQILEFLLDMPEVLSMFIQPIFCYSQLPNKSVCTCLSNKIRINSKYFQVSVNGPDTLTGDTCLVAAAHSGQRGCCNILLRRGAKTSVTNLSDLPPLHAAVSGGHWGITEMLLKEGANLEQKDGLGRTPVIVSAAEGHSAVIEHLLSKKACIGKL